MPIVRSKGFSVPSFLINSHFETIYASMCRRVAQIPYDRERISTRDNDFLDIDWFRNNSDKLAILCHGLEGNSERTYMRGMAVNLLNNGWDILAWNNRGCSGTQNNNFKLYHHGDIEDLKDVLYHVVEKTDYKKIDFVGFSMGGSHVLKYLSTHAGNLPENVYRAVVFSVPCNLGDSIKNLSRFSNTFYQKRFLKKLKNKIKAKHQRFPDKVDLNILKTIRNIEQLDRNFTLQFLNLKSLNELYAYGSVVHYIPELKTPVLLVNARNDPMLPESCYPWEIAGRNKFLYLEVPKRGGHVGFFDGNHNTIWSERRKLEFLKDEKL